MVKKRHHTHIHPVKAFVYIGLAVFFSVWLVSAAIPNRVKADDEVSLLDIISAKDVATELELAKPGIVFPVIDTIESADTQNTISPLKTGTQGLTLTLLPKGGQQSVKSPILIIGSSKIDISLLQESFSITPNVPGTFKSNQEIIVFTPDAPLAPQTKYTITVNSGILGSNKEMLQNSVSATFETRPDIHILPVPFFRQQYSRSCEAASLRMALAYQGVTTNDMNIVRAAGYDPKDPDWANRIWDDPYEMFVGFIDGVQAGYGMYAPALKKSSESLGRNASVLKNPKPEDIAREVVAGNPVVVWGYISGTAPKLSYFTTFAGNRVPIYSNEHARTVVGVLGSAENPVGFYIHDPLSGKANEYWTKDELSRHMNVFGEISNQALVVYPLN